MDFSGKFPGELHPIFNNTHLDTQALTPNLEFLKSPKKGFQKKNITIHFHLKMNFVTKNSNFSFRQELQAVHRLEKLK